MDGLRLPRNGKDNAPESVLETTVARSLDHADRASGRFALACTESIYRLLQNADYATAASEFGEVQRSLRWAMSPGKNTGRLCWRTQGEAFIRTKSSSALTDIDATRRVVRLPFPAGKLRLTGLRLDPASQAGFARLFAIRVLSSTGSVVWEWDGRVATLEACDTRSITFLARTGQPGVIAHFHDGNAAIVLPFGGGDVRVPEEGGVLEFEFAWLATSALAGPEFANGAAQEFRAWNAELADLREKLAAHASRAQVSSKELEAVAAEKGRLEAELQLAADWRRAVVRSWSWRLTTPLRFVGSFFAR
jgi:hypothetical protein